MPRASSGDLRAGPGVKQARGRERGLEESRGGWGHRKASEGGGREEEGQICTGVPFPPSGAPRTKGITLLALPFDLLTSFLTRGALGQ